MTSKTKSFFQGALAGSSLTLGLIAALSPKGKTQIVKVIKVVRGAGRKKTQDLEPETNLAGN